MYQRRESNPHIRGYTILSRARLPVPPLWLFTTFINSPLCAPAHRSVSRRRVHQFRHFGFSLHLFNSPHCAPAHRSVSRRRVYQFRHFGYRDALFCCYMLPFFSRRSHGSLPICVNRRDRWEPRQRAANMTKVYFFYNRDLLLPVIGLFKWIFYDRIPTFRATNLIHENFKT